MAIPDKRNCEAAYISLEVRKLCRRNSAVAADAEVVLLRLGEHLIVELLDGLGSRNLAVVWYLISCQRKDYGVDWKTGRTWR